MPTERPTILIVDDNRDIREMTAELLTLRGFDVRTAAEAADILPTIRRERPDVVLQDVYMPHLDVGGLLRDVRKEPAIAKTRIVLFTASVAGDSIADELGADGIIHKPFDLDVLVRKLHAVLHPGAPLPASA